MHLSALFSFLISVVFQCFPWQFCSYIQYILMICTPTLQLSHTWKHVSLSTLCPLICLHRSLSNSLTIVSAAFMHMGNLPAATHTKNNDFLLPQEPSIINNCSISGRTSWSRPSSLLKLFTVLILCKLVSDQECNGCPVPGRHYFTAVLMSPGHLHFSCSYPVVFPEPYEGDVNLPFKAEHAAVTFSQYFVQLWASILASACQEKDLLWSKLRTSLINA